MALVTISETNRTIEDADEVSRFLSDYGIWYRRFEDLDQIADDASDEQILACYGKEIDEQKARGGYTTADVVDLKPDIDGLDGLLARFSREHWHSEDEVRFIVRGRGIFHVHPKDGAVFRIEVREGDMINVPQGTLHWFDLCEEKRIRAIRLFQDVSGWTPHYTDSGEDSRHQPLCLGPSQFPPGATRS